MTIELSGETATARLASEFAPALRAGDTVTLSGDVGAGKTTFARYLLAALGHRGEVPSPTFSIIQPYDHLDPPVWHADLYRIEDPSELEEIGLDALGEGVLLVEWPEKAGPGAFRDALDLHFAIRGEGRRRLTATVPAAWEGRWPPR